MAAVARTSVPTPMTRPIHRLFTGWLKMLNELHISVDERDGVREFEQHILTAQKRSNATLRVPISISHEGDLGRSVAFAQLVATWADTCTSQHIRAPLSMDDPQALKRFISRLHGLTAAYYADQIVAKDGKTNLRKELLKAAKPRIEAMGERKFNLVAKGRLTELIFVHRANNQFHSATYLGQPSVADLKDPQRHGELIVSAREMNALIRNILKAQNLPKSDFKRLTPLLDRERYPLGHLLHETFRNTAEHAYLDSSGRIPPKGVRCVLIALRYCQPDLLKPDRFVSVEHPNLTAYFKGLRERCELQDRSLVRFLELSVLDTGPGFAATIETSLGPKFGMALSDANLVTECFRVHVSSKLGPNSGLGLGRVLSLVNSLGGFIRIRTSTTETFFSSSKEANASLAPHVAADLSKVCGTALTIAIPL